MNIVGRIAKAAPVIFILAYLLSPPWRLGVAAGFRIRIRIDR